MPVLQFQFHNYQFTSKLLSSFIALLIVMFLISLGVWQLHRAEVKHQIDDNVIQAQYKSPLKFNHFINNENNFEDQIYRKASMTGNYHNQINFLLDNRTHKGKAGFHVLTPFLLESGSDTSKAVLINRGWIPYQGTRDNIQDISISNKEIELTGAIMNVGDSIILGDDNQKSLTYPKIIQSVSLEKLSHDIQFELLPIIIQLDKAEESGFVREWQPYYGTADKSTAYAVQWFSMAVVLFFLFIKLNTKKTNTQV